MGLFYPDREDDPVRMRVHEGRFHGGKALAVLGGDSGEKWEQLRDEIQPDVILTANGATRLPGADYWLSVENMKFCHGRALKGDKRLEKFLAVYDKENTAPVQMYGHLSWDLLDYYGIDKSKCICVKRAGYEADEIPDEFSLRRYGDGLLAGGIARQKEGWNPKVIIRTGTVGLQLLHLAGLLGCAEVHTIGFDLVSKRGDGDHWYPWPKYVVDRFRREEMFVDYKGVRTQLWWIEAAEYLKNIEYLFQRDGLKWRDYSDGLLKVDGVFCTQ